MDSVKILATHDLRKKFIQGDTIIEVLSGINISFFQGKTYALTGASGAGKSTLIHVLAGLDSPSSGEVTFAGRDIASFTACERQQFFMRSVGLVFQSPHLIQELSVLENIIFKGMLEGRTPEVCRDRALFLLEQVGLSDKVYSRPAALSGGQQQRVAIARAIFSEPAFLLADEPTGNVDIDTGMRIIDLLLACHQKWGMGVIVSSHDPYVAACMNSTYRLEAGQLTVV